MIRRLVILTRVSCKTVVSLLSIIFPHSHFNLRNQTVFVAIRALSEMQLLLIEYAIIISLVALVIFVVILTFGPKVGDSYSTINNSIP